MRDINAVLEKVINEIPLTEKDLRTKVAATVSQENKWFYLGQVLDAMMNREDKQPWMIKALNAFNGRV